MLLLLQPPSARLKLTFFAHINCRLSKESLTITADEAKGRVNAWVTLKTLKPALHWDKLSRNFVDWKFINFALWKQQRLIVWLSYHKPGFLFLFSTAPFVLLHRLFMLGIKFYGHEKKEIRRWGKIDYIFLLLIFIVKCGICCWRIFLFLRMEISHFPS